MATDKLKAIAPVLLKKWWASLLLLPFVIYALHQMYWTFRFNIFFAITYDFPFPINFIQFLLNNFLLIIHEAGHTFFGILGNRTLTILGGSLFEVLLPLLIVAYFWFNQKKTGLQLSLYMAGTAFLNVAYYAADAGARQLPLIGGLSKEAHDWFNLLSRWGMLDSDQTVGLFIASAGILCFLAALLLPAFFKKYEEVELDIDI